MNINAKHSSLLQAEERYKKKKNNIAFWKAKHKWQRKTNGECTLAGLQCAAYKQLNICTFPIFQEHQGPHLWFLESGNYKASHVTKLLYSFHIAINTNLIRFPSAQFTPPYPFLPSMSNLRTLLCHHFQQFWSFTKGVGLKWNDFAYALFFSFCSRALLHIKNVAWSEKNHRFTKTKKMFRSFF